MCGYVNRDYYSQLDKMFVLYKEYDTFYVLGDIFETKITKRDKSFEDHMVSTYVLSVH